jgi:hypothetical protein
MTVGYPRLGYAQGKYAIHQSSRITEASLEWAAPVLLIQP